MRLADGQSWTLPGPERFAGEDDAEYRALVEAVAEAEDWADRLRSELALAIYLLGCNYDLDARGFGALLDLPGGPALDALQRAIGSVAAEHVRQHATRGLAEGPRPAARARAFWSALVGRRPAYPAR